MKEILIFAELMPTSQIQQVVFELCAVAKQLSIKLNDAKISAIVINDGVNSEEITQKLALHGFNKVYFFKSYKYKNYSTLLYTNAIYELISEIKPAIVLFGATRLGRDLAPRVSAKLNCGLTADCTSLDIDENGKLAATRPTFGGNLMATIMSKSDVQMATVRPNVFKPTYPQENNNIEVEEKNYFLDNLVDTVELLSFKPFDSSFADNITDAEIIVAGGRGMKGKEGFGLIKELANVIGAKVGATRAAVDLGWADTSIQIGQTGKIVTPKIYIACGISGAIQHLVGINSADTIVAINSDENAPIFKNADYGIVGDAFVVLPKLISVLKGEK